MKRATLSHIFIVWTMHRKHPETVELWYSTKKDDHLVITLDRKVRDVVVLSAKIVTWGDISGRIDVTPIDTIWDRFSISPTILYDAYPIKFYNKYWKNGNQIF